MKACLILTTFALGFSFIHSGEAVEQKFGYVELQKIILSVEEGKQAREMLEKEYKAKKDELEQMENQLKSMKSSLEQQSMILNEDALRKKTKDYQDQLMKFQRMFASHQKEIQDTEMQLTGQIIEKVKAIVGQIAEKNGYTYVFEKSDNVLLFAPDNDNLTQKVIEAYNTDKKKKK